MLPLGTFIPGSGESILGSNDTFGIIVLVLDVYVLFLIVLIAVLKPVICRFANHSVLKML